MRALRRSRGLALAGLACATFACATNDYASVETPILGGIPDATTEAVVYFENDVENCTGTLISPHVVLTARHCVQATGAAEPMPAESFFVGFGSSFPPFGVWPSERHRVRRVVAAAGVWDGNASSGEDVALLVLEEPAPMAPLLFRRDAPADRVGTSVTVIGFGLTAEGGTAGTRTVGTTTLDRIDDGRLYARGITCFADSGGPMLEEIPVRRVIGVTVAGIGTSCATATDVFNRIDTHLALIEPAIREAGDCVASDERCNSLDDDCDARVDETCVPLGEPCEADDACALAQLPPGFPPLAHPTTCASTASGRICTRTCDLADGDAPCAAVPHPFDDRVTPWAGAICVRDATCEARCAAIARGPQGVGTECASDDDCASIRCGDASDGHRRCFQPCVGGHADCAHGEACTADTDACGVCVDSVGRSRLALGEPCVGDGDCASGLCRIAEHERYCSIACADDGACVDGFRCDAGSCARGARGAAGEPCATSEECTTGTVCIRRGSEGWCAAPACESVEDCPTAFECVPVGASSVCAPTRSLLGSTCRLDADCVSDVCRAGVCTTECASSARCAPGFLCARDAEGVTASCVRAPPMRGSTCAATASSSSGAALALWLTALALSRRRRGLSGSASRA